MFNSYDEAAGVFLDGAFSHIFDFAGGLKSALLSSMRFTAAFFLLISAAFAAVPPELAAALKDFRADAPRGWSFTQTTVAEGKSLVEHCDAAKPEFDRWSLLQQDGRAPTEAEFKNYADVRSRRSRGGTAPKLTEQLNLATLETVADTPERVIFRCQLKPGEMGDKTSEFLRVTLVLHKPTKTIESFELASTGEFAPTFGVKIAEMKTALTYTLPTGDRPSLPDKVTTHQRGRAFFFKSLDADMTVTFTDYERVGTR